MLFRSERSAKQTNANQPRSTRRRGFTSAAAAEAKIAELEAERQAYQQRGRTRRTMAAPNL
jgi:hypothetical protein